MKQQFLKDVAGTIRMTAYDRNRAVVPSSATIVLKKSGGDTLQASTSATVDGTTGEMTYSLTSTHTANVDLNYIAEWTYVVSGTTYYENQLFDVVKSVLSVPITDDDLYNELDSLREANYQETGTATAGDASSLTDTANRKEPDDFWNGGVLEVIAGTGANQVRDVSDFVQSTAKLSVSPNWVTNPDATSEYRVIRSWTKKIERAFETIEDMLYNKGERANLIIESSQIRMPMIYMTIHLIALDLRNTEGDKWDLTAVEYKEKFQNAFNTMRVDYDRDESGTISGEEEQYNPASVRVSRG